jgi:hypothetical protein
MSAMLSCPERPVWLKIVGWLPFVKVLNKRQVAMAENCCLQVCNGPEPDLNQKKAGEFPHRPFVFQPEPSVWI